MPTILPHGPLRRRLTFCEAAELLLTLVRMAALNRRMTLVAAQTEGPLNERPEFRAAALTWCGLSARLARITGRPEHVEASEIRALFGPQADLPPSPLVGKSASEQGGRGTEMPTKH